MLGRGICRLELIVTVFHDSLSFGGSFFNVDSGFSTLEKIFGKDSATLIIQEETNYQERNSG